MADSTLNDAVVILDEAPLPNKSNISHPYGYEYQMIVTGDMTQMTFPSCTSLQTGTGAQVLKGVKGISFIELNKDIVRHKLVTRIVEAYEKKYDKKLTIT